MKSNTICSMLSIIMLFKSVWALENIKNGRCGRQSPQYQYNQPTNAPQPDNLNQSSADNYPVKQDNITYPPVQTAVSVDSIVGKNMVGYQGWFTCRNGIGNQHWEASGLVIDMLPDVSEYDPRDLCTLSDYKDSQGNPIKVFSSESPGVVDVHFKWMKDYGMDGVFVQEFFTDMRDKVAIEKRLNVTQNVKNSAEKYGRAWSTMFDVTGVPGDALRLFKEIFPLFEDMIRSSPMYLKENGKPLIAVWGFGGVEGRHITDPKVAIQIVQYFKDRGYSVYGGFAHGSWSTNLDAWKEAINCMNVFAPWNVGFTGGYNAFKAKVEKDLAFLRDTNVIYSPVIYPGFSWKNLQKTSSRKESRLNEIPRNGGALYSQLADAAIAAGANNLYTAMFDEVNEGTAIFKTIARKKDLPQKGEFVALDHDGYEVPSDYYLQLAGKYSQKLKQ